MDLKQEVAAAALKLVESGMNLGLGSGSTMAYFVDLLGEKVKSGELKNLRCVSTSESTATRARTYGIQLYSLRECPNLDLAIDGADEVDPQLNLIKGLGRALLREKIVEIHARRLLIIVDESKLVDHLGTKCPLPVELVPFEVDTHLAWLNTLGCRAELWEENSKPIVTDNANYYARCYFEHGIADPYALALVLAQRPGIVEHGLFLDMATQVIVSSPAGIRSIGGGT